MELIEASQFTDWFVRLRDPIAKIAMFRRLDRLRLGLIGDAKPVGGGVSELRIDVGPGSRIYIARFGEVTIILLCGGDKSSQQRDIERARRLREEWKEKRPWN